MTRRRCWPICGLIMLLACVPGWAQHRHDPLNDLEIDQLRDTAMEPDLRLKLYIKFSRDRLDALEKVRADAKVPNRAREIHDRLRDFLDVYDESNDNVDTFARRKADLRKILKTVIEADTEFQAKLQALKDSADAAAVEAKQYEFLLNDALDALKNGAEDHRQLLAEQEEEFKHKKKEKQ